MPQPEPSTSTSRRNKRKFVDDIDEESAAALCTSTAQVSRLISSMKRESAVVFVYKCRETLHSLMPLSTRPTALPMTPAPMPQPKRQKVILAPSKLSGHFAKRDAAARTDTPIDQISNLLDNQLKIKDVRPHDIESIVKP